MSWWDDLTSWLDGFYDDVVSVKNELYGWVWDIAEEWGKYGADTAKYLTDAIWREIDDFTDIVFHTWHEVTNLVSEAIDGLGDIVDHTWHEVTDAVDSAVSEAKVYTDTIERSLLAVLSEAEEVAGAARAELEKALLSAIKVVEDAGKAGLELLDTTLTSLISGVEQSAKEAREILEGNLIYLLEELGTTLELLLQDVYDFFNPLIDGLTKSLSDAWDWINNADTWFSTQFDTMKDRVIGWIIDKFEYILDTIFTEED